MIKTCFRWALIVAVASLVLLGGRLYASETDDRIESAAKQSYVFKKYLTADDIKIQSRDGDVTLSGTVSDDASRTLAQETVASLPGVKSIDNRLKIKGKSPEPYSDAWLITKVKTALLFHRSVSASKTEVLANKGIVTLRGEASSSAQMDLVTEYARDVEGVKDVKNEMTVSGVPVKSGETIFREKMGALGDSIDDASVTALVITTLLYHRSTSALNTKVSTKDGVVTLGGTAKNSAEKELSTKLVDDVRGVKQVVNNMTVTGAN
ncbi:MAG: BON domain-containing protein [Proteobacteria bacterium]|nr:BON domain-containing protein [Pseudomonadota bacterium]